MPREQSARQTYRPAFGWEDADGYIRVVGCGRNAALPSMD